MEKPLSPPQRLSLNLRILPEAKNMIDAAAELRGKTRTDFILEAAQKAVEETLLDRSILLVQPDAYAAFLQRLDAPPQPNERLRRSMNTAAPWE